MMRVWRRPDLVLAFLGPFAVYAYSLMPGVGFWDTAEMQLDPWIFGIPHPTGFPAFIVLAGIFAHLVPFGDPAWRVNLFTAAAMAGASVTLALFLTEFGVPRATAIVGGWLFAAGDVAWTRGDRAEVQALATFFGTLALLQGVRWLRTGRPRDAYVAAAAWGLALATHPVALFLGPALLCMAVLGYRRLTPARAGFVVLAGIVPLALYALIPLRSAYLYAVRRDPTLALGLPPGRPFWDTNHAAAGLSSYLDAAPGEIGGGVLGIFAPEHWNAIAQRYDQSLFHEYGTVGIVAGLVGLAFALKARPVLWSALVVSVLITVPFILSYPEADQDRYFLDSFWLFAALATIGVHRTLTLALGRIRLAPVGALVAGIAVACMSLGLANANRADAAAGRDYRYAQTFIEDVEAATPSNAIIISDWSYVTPLGYARYATDTFGDRIPISAHPTDYASSYRRWLETRPIYVHVLGGGFSLPPDYGVVATSYDPESSLVRLELAPPKGAVTPAPARR